MKRKPKPRTTSNEVMTWVLANYPAAHQYEQEHETLDGFSFPSADAKSYMLYVLLNPKEGLKTLVTLRHQSETKAAAKRPKSAIDDMRRQFAVLDRLAAAIPLRPMPGGPDMGVDPELYRPE